MELSTLLLPSIFNTGSYNVKKPPNKSLHTTFGFFAKNNILLTRNNIRCSKQRFIFQIQGGNNQIITFSQKRKKKY